MIWATMGDKWAWLQSARTQMSFIVFPGRSAHRAPDPAATHANRAADAAARAKRLATPGPLR